MSGLRLLSKPQKATKALGAELGTLATSPPCENGFAQQGFWTTDTSKVCDVPAVTAGSQRRSPAFRAAHSSGALYTHHLFSLHHCTAG